MRKTIHICDKCGNETIAQPGEIIAYRTIGFAISDKGQDYIQWREYSNTAEGELPKRYYLCPKCLLAFGIDENFCHNRKKPQAELASIEDQLLENFISYVTERVKESMN